jgi:hypothetical protein
MGWIGMARTKTARSFDDDVKELIEAHEAGVDDALKAYEYAEKRYFEAVSATTVAPSLVPATTTTPGPSLAGANTLSE